MTLAFRSHLKTHSTERRQVGAGIVRVTCTICPRLELEETTLPTSDSERTHALNARFGRRDQMPSSA